MSHNTRMGLVVCFIDSNFTATVFSLEKRADRQKRYIQLRAACAAAHKTISQTMRIVNLKKRIYDEIDMDISLNAA